MIVRSPRVFERKTDSSVEEIEPHTELIQVILSVIVEQSEEI